jgi:superfamily II DNA or RNA helicase
VRVALRFHAGTLLLVLPADLPSPFDPGEGWAWDDRVGRWRARADRYRERFAELYRRAGHGEFELVDEARGYQNLPLELHDGRTPRSYQREAILAWERAGRRGQIVLPTGAGKSFVAFLAMQSAARSTLIVVPTIDLMHQWQRSLLEAFAVDRIGQLGGGAHELEEITVSTYDSAALHLDRYGDRFGLIIWDECHHLPGPTYLEASSFAIAPFRLGLTATPERQDGRESLLDEAVGPICYRLGIREMAGEVLADYEVCRIPVDLTPEEEETYRTERELYRAFVRSRGIRFDRPDGWSRFIQLSARSRDGRRAMRAFRAQRRIALTCDGKLELVEELLAQHREDRAIVFTNDNDTVYALSRRLLVPCITHQTPTAERREILERFRDGTYRAVLTSRVLNEGVDVPEAGVAIVLSGTGSVREHVQRLGRILRRDGDKQAVLYELVTAGTVEEHVSTRRREHDAYR